MLARLAIAVLVASLSGASASADEAGPPPVLAVDPDDPGPSLPPVGHSLFDFLTTREVNGALVQEVPFPFTALQAQIADALGGAEPDLKQVLIPLGRSLQRNAANPDFFAFPRAVVAVDQESEPRAGEGGMLLADRLYLGYQERAATIEVISYNEAAARFEYQVVLDYREGGDPVVYYADRPTCIACHRNHAPIFSKALWDETNANAHIAATLSGLRDSFYGIPVARGVDIPNAIDDATDRANSYAALQRVWQDGCALPEAKDAVACRADGLLAALHYKLAGNRHPAVDQEGPASAFAEALSSRWEELWPGGLAVPEGDVPNRAPLAGPLDASIPLSEADAIRLSSVERVFEPFEPRPPSEVWQAPRSAELRRRLAQGLAQFVARSDIQRLDAILWQQDAPITKIEGDCTVAPVDLGGGRSEIRLECADPSSLSLQGYVQLEDGTVAGGTITRLQIGGQVLTNLRVAGGAYVPAEGQLEIELSERAAGLHARLPDGNAIRQLDVRWTETGQGLVAARIASDAAMLSEAVSAMQQSTLAGESDALGPAPLRRAVVMAALFAQLGQEPIDWCCVDDTGMPVAALEP